MQVWVGWSELNEKRQVSVDMVVLVLGGNAAFNPSQPDLGCNGTCSLVCPSKDP